MFGVEAQGGFEVEAPVSERLRRQPGDQIKADVCKAGFAQRRDGAPRVGRRVRARQAGEFFIDE